VSGRRERAIVRCCSAWPVECHAAVADGGCGAVRKGRDETRQTESMAGWQDTGPGQAAWHGSASESLHHPSKALPQPFEKEYRTTLPAVPAPLIDRYGHTCDDLQSHPACTCFAMSCPVLSLLAGRAPSGPYPGDSRKTARYRTPSGTI
jgi:hypothetical protein